MKVPSISSWGASLLLHACAGAALCFAYRGQPAASEPVEPAVALDLPAALLWHAPPEPERPAEEPEMSPPGPTHVLDPLPSSEPAEIALPQPAVAAKAEVGPPDVPECPLGWELAVEPPAIGELAWAPEASAQAEAEPAAAPAPAPAAPPPAALPAPEPAAEPTDAPQPPSGPCVPPAICAGNAPPAYPLAARRRGHEGLVVLRAKVSATGQCLAVAVVQSSGHGELDSAAAEAVRGWSFRPALRGGAPVEAELDIPIRFKLADG